MFEISPPEVMCSAETMINQAGGTVAYYLRAAIKEIDAEFGKDFAKDHPELVGAFIQACSRDLHAGMVKAGAQDIRDALSGVADAILYQNVR